MRTLIQRVLKPLTEHQKINCIKKCHFSEYKIYSDGLINPEFSTNIESIKNTGRMPIFRVLDTNGYLLEDWKAPYSDDEVLQIYKEMIKFSIFDKICYSIQRQGRIMFYIGNQGEEALHFGVGKALKPEDHIYAQYREAGILLCKGMTYNCFLDQLFGTKDDEGKGRQMPICYTKKKLNIHTITTPLTSQLTHSAGCGYALKLQNQKAVSLAFCGDGGASEGDFYAALNFASVRKSQTMFICKNNVYAISTHVKDQYCGDGIAPRAVSLGIESLRVDGNDIFASYYATKKMREICINESKPVFIEFMAYRYSHHSTSDDCTLYKPEHEIKSWNKEGVSGISRLYLYLKNKNLINDKENETLSNDIKKEILKLIKKYENAKRYNIVGGLFEDIYKDEEWNIKEQKESFQDFFKNYMNYYKISKYEK